MGLPWALAALLLVWPADTRGQTEPNTENTVDRQRDSSTPAVTFIPPSTLLSQAKAPKWVHIGELCSTWGDFHYKTFDGDVFRFPGLCNYVFSAHCGAAYEDFNVQLRRGLLGDRPAISHIVLKVQGLVLELFNHSVFINGQRKELPYSQAGLLVQHSNGFVRVQAGQLLRFLWNGEDGAQLALNRKYVNQTCGLCGDFNGLPAVNEFYSHNTKLTPIQFGNLQKMDGPTEQCQDTLPSPADNCTDEEGFCHRVLHSWAFAECSSLMDTRAFVAACIQDLCRCPTCTCDTFTEFSRQCAHSGGRPLSWRSPSLCPRTCPLNLQYQECGSPCVDTCSNPQGSQICEDHCTDGCFCPQGTVLDDVTHSGCLALAQCPCTHRGQIYAPGSSFNTSCSSCTCSGGLWRCQDLPCPGSCSVQGGSHISTYDEKLYDVHGDCSYVLSKKCADSTFTVLVELRKCGLTDTENCLRLVTLVLEGGDTVIQIQGNGRVFMNSIYTQLPMSAANVTIFRPSSFFILVQTALGLQLQVQLVPLMQVSVRLDPAYRGQMCGLCGNFNQNQADDFTALSGVVEATSAAFSNTWKTQASCPNAKNSFEDPCSLSVENEKYAQHWCSRMTDPAGAFAACHSSVNPASFYSNCMFDTCNCQRSEDCLCAALSSYVHACAAKGVQLSGWRDGVCAKYMEDCPKSQSYAYVIASCTPSCRSLSEADVTCDVPFVPVDGCTCPAGTYLNDVGVCVPAQECPCYLHGSVVAPGEVVQDGGVACSCASGRLTCMGDTLQDSPGCASPMVYLDCGNAPPGATGVECLRSCHMLEMECFSTHCVSGCVCPDGLVADGKGGCLAVEDCPCMHNEDSYQPGETIQVDCNTCTCRNRRWECSHMPCLSTCVAYGDGHYITFDGERYTFEGSCEYTLAQDYCGADASAGGTFRIITENVPCGTTGATCSKAIKLFLESHELILHEGAFKVVERGQGGPLPYRVRYMGIFLVIETSSGIVMSWDRKTSVFIRMKQHYKGRVCGLCGNFDGNALNDFTTRGQAVVGDALEFGNSWKLSPSCPDAPMYKDPCTANPYRKSWAQKQCSIINSGVFAGCHAQVDPTKYYEACVSDACACDSGGDCECFCTAVAAYAQACHKAGVCVSWRTPDVCPLFCDYYNPKGECEWHYQPCGEPCLKTCRNPSGRCQVELPGLEGCYPKCPPHKPFFNEDEMKCVAQCGCYDKDGNYHDINTTVPTSENCQSCCCTPTGLHCEYSLSACTCTYEGQTYRYKDVIYNTTDGLGACLTAICGDNGTIIRKAVDCPQVLSTTPFAFTSTAAPLSTTGLEPTTSTMCVREVCHWSAWYDSGRPESGLEGGDFETYENLTRRGYLVCQDPVAIECQAALFPGVVLQNVGQKVDCDLAKGLVCLNSEQRPPLCHNYEVRVLCCDLVPCGLSPSPETSTLPPQPRTSPETTRPAAATSTAHLGSLSSLSTITATRGTARPVTTVTLSSQAASTWRTSPVASPASTLTSGATACQPRCQWTQWFDTSYPKSEIAGGDIETFERARAAGGQVCERPQNISCEAELFPGTPVHQLGQRVLCDLHAGLACYNRDQEPPFAMCYNYRIRALCCSTEHCRGTLATSAAPASTTAATASTTAATATTHSPASTSAATATTHSPASTSAAPASTTAATATTHSPASTTAATASTTAATASTTAATATTHSPASTTAATASITVATASTSAATATTHSPASTSAAPATTHSPASTTAATTSTTAATTHSPTSTSAATASTSAATATTHSPASTTAATTHSPASTTAATTSTTAATTSTTAATASTSAATATTHSPTSTSAATASTSAATATTHSPASTSTATATTHSPASTSAATSHSGTPASSTHTRPLVTATTQSSAAPSPSPETTTPQGTTAELTPTTSATTAASTTAPSSAPVQATSRTSTGTGSTSAPGSTPVQTTHPTGTASTTATHSTPVPTTSATTAASTTAPSSAPVQATSRTSTGTAPTTASTTTPVQTTSPVGTATGVTSTSRQTPRGTLTSTTRPPSPGSTPKSLPVTRQRLTSKETSRTTAPSTATPGPSSTAVRTAWATASTPPAARGSTSGRSPTTPEARPTACKPRCAWTGWLDQSYPLPGASGGDFETYANLRAAGVPLCARPRALECRSQAHPDKTLQELGQVVTCHLSVGLECWNRDQAGTFQLCLNYQVRVLCCDTSHCPSSPPSTTAPPRPTHGTQPTATAASTATTTPEPTTPPTGTATTTPVPTTPPTGTASTTASHSTPVPTTPPTGSASTTASHSTPVPTTHPTGTASTTASTTTPVPTTHPTGTASTTASTTTPVQTTPPTGTASTTTPVQTTPPTGTASTTTPVQTTPPTGTASTTTPVQTTPPTGTASTTTPVQTTPPTGTASTTTPVQTTPPTGTASTTTPVQTTPPTGTASTTASTTTPVLTTPTTGSAFTTPVPTTPPTGTASTTTPVPTTPPTGTASTTAKHSTPVPTTHPTGTASTTPVPTTHPMGSASTMASTTPVPTTPPTGTASTTAKHSTPVPTTPPTGTASTTAPTSTPVPTTSRTTSPTASASTTAPTSTPVQTTSRTTSAGTTEYVTTPSPTPGTISATPELTTSEATAQGTTETLTTSSALSRTTEASSPGSASQPSVSPSVTAQTSPARTPGAPTGTSLRPTEPLTPSRTPTPQPTTSRAPPGTPSSATPLSTTTRAAPGQSTTRCQPRCEWTEWFDMDAPTSGVEGGDSETYDIIRAAGGVLCESPVKIECRAENYPEVSIDQIGQVVNCSLQSGLVCRNRDQKAGAGMCYNYNMRLLCCDHYSHCPSSAAPPATSSTAPGPRTEAPTATATATSTSTLPRPTAPTAQSTATATLSTTPGLTAGTSRTTAPSTATPGPSSTAVRTAWATASTPPAARGSTSGRSPTTPEARPTACKPRCAWTGWLDQSYPLPGASGGDFETYANLRAAGVPLCARPRALECRSQAHPDKTLQELGQAVTCHLSVGLECWNRDQAGAFQLCLNYQVRVLCCDTSHCPSSPPSTTAPPRPTHGTQPTATAASTAATTPEPTTPPTGTASTTPVLTTPPTGTATTTATHSTPVPTTHPTGTASTTASTTTPEPTTPPTGTASTTPVPTTHPTGTASTTAPSSAPVQTTSRTSTGTAPTTASTTTPVQTTSPVGTATGVTSTSRQTPRGTLTSTTRPPSPRSTPKSLPVTRQRLTSKETSRTTAPSTATPGPSSTAVRTAWATSSTPPAARGSTSGRSPTTPEARPTACKPRCAWTGWLDQSYPLPGSSGGDFETYANLRAAGVPLCARPRALECRSQAHPDKTLQELGQVVTCHLSVGLECWNRDQAGTFQLCLNYQVRVLCCDTSHCPSSPPSTTAPPRPTHGTQPTATAATTATTTPVPTTPPTGTATTTATHSTPVPTTHPTGTASTTPEPTTPPTGTASTTATHSTPVPTTPPTGTASTTTPVQTTPPTGTASTTTPVPTTPPTGMASTTTPVPTTHPTGTASTTTPVQTTPPTGTASTTTPVPTTPPTGMASTTPVPTTPPTGTASTTPVPTTPPTGTASTTPVPTTPPTGTASTTPVPTTHPTGTASTTPVPTTPPTGTASTTTPVPTTHPTGTASTTASTTTPVPTTHPTGTASTTTPVPTTPPTGTASTTPVPTMPPTGTASTTPVPTTHPTGTASTTTPVQTTPPTGTASTTASTTTPVPTTPPTGTASTTTPVPTTHPTGTASTTTPVPTTHPTGTASTTTPVQTTPPTGTASTTPVPTTHPTGTASTTPVPTMHPTGTASTTPVPTTPPMGTASTTATYSTPVPTTSRATSSGSAGTTPRPSATPESSSTPTASHGSPGTLTVSTTSQPGQSTLEATTSGPPLSPWPCFCRAFGQLFSPGDVIYNKTDRAGCHFYAVCNQHCDIDRFQGACSTPVPTAPPSPLPPGCSNTVPPRQVNETWTLENCTVARCEGDGQVVLLEPEPVANVTCVNGHLPIRVDNQSQPCHFHYECECACSGWGHWHYSTFDGITYSFPDNCTSILMREIRPRFGNLTILLYNQYCAAASARCPRALAVRYESMEIVLSTAIGRDGKDECLILLNQKQMARSFSKNGVKVSMTTGTTMTVDITAIGVSVTFDGHVFQILLSYSHFSLNTEGQCGTCSNSHLDECRLPDGTVASSCRAMAPAWRVPGDSREGCGQPPRPTPSTSPQVLSSTASATPCPGERLCEALLSPVFKECHRSVPPGPFLDTCKQDSCGSGEPCRSLEAYATLCLSRGVCTDWRNATGGQCEYSCPASKVYKPCGPAQPPSCDSWKPRPQSGSLAEGCFCPEDQILLSWDQDICVPDCPCVGPDGYPKFPGERWVSNCQTCVCEAGSVSESVSVSVRCEPVHCEAQAPPPQCGQAGFVALTRPQAHNQCCSETLCVCNVTTCPQDLPTCGPAEELTRTQEQGACCPSFSCGPKLCTYNGTVYGVGATFPGVIPCHTCNCSSLDTGSLKVLCEKDVCTTTCPQGFQYEEEAGRCCGKCMQVSCLVPDGRPIGLNETWIDSSVDNCTLYQCQEQNGVLTLLPKPVTCPPVASCRGTLRKVGCCYTCEQEDKCQVRSNQTILRHQGCQSEAAVNVTFCEGACPGTSKYSMETQSMEHRCTCCQESRTHEESVTLRCPEGKTLQHAFTFVDECSCSPFCTSPPPPTQVLL